ncbi:ABC transporter substrate-binding protein [Tepidanaerobacter syntrophicus]|uniref:Branched-chain amino acid transport system substrate-binding protein n=1 Tax=Tepidanaerobacter syntrophicus TaxID=224999 RepID=A0A0U9HP64_9FIRM|nr:ABC transporter substrate-binding protein [Tepidanaerobacter syntrophicus]GAQ25903.1 branched-chain amino acid transport system substrate-binding protein [Tepidanaerobacter syntrophicus]
MLKKLIVLLLTVVLLVTVAGCGGGSTQQGSQTEQNGAASNESGDKEPIKIGYIGALSGETALWGQAGLNGMLLAEKDINDACGILGRQVKVISYDGKGEPLDSVNALNKLIDQDKCVAVVGTNFSSCNIPMASVADEKKVPVIATAASSPLVTVDESGKLHPYSFRIGFTDPFQGRVIASYAYKELNIKNAAILTNIADAYSTGITQYLIDEFTKLGGKIVAHENASSGDNDFRAQLSKIKAAKPEALFIPWIYKDVALIVKQARELGIDCVFIGADGWDSQDLPKLAGDAIEGGYFCSRPGFNTPEAKKFAERYQSVYKITPEAECLFGYDGLMWIKDAIEREGAADSESIRKGLESTTNFTGLLGKMSVDPKTHDPVRDAAIFKIEGGQVKFVQIYTP